jgi:hypothetical protein
MRFRDSATELFPELRHQRVSQRLSGEFSIELATATDPEIAVAQECAVDYLVFLNRKNPTPQGLFRLPKNKVLRWLQQVACYGEQHIREEHKAALRSLVTADVFEMRYSGMDSALRLLERLIHHGPYAVHESLVAAGGRENG